MGLRGEGWGEEGEEEKGMGSAKNRKRVMYAFSVAGFCHTREFGGFEGLKWRNCPSFGARSGKTPAVSICFCFCYFSSPISILALWCVEPKTAPCP